ncbi:DNA topoisomerase [Enterococcus faecalis]|uniref:DNA topoisomerase n=1 Tax=Enterococcus faecalis TaxID=1351 RepID=UPI00325A73B0
MVAKQLIIAEKPSVAKDLSRVLGANQKNKNYYEGPNVIVTWALGHLLGLKMPEDLNKEWQTWQMETLPMIPKNLGIKPLPKTGHQLKAIKQLANRKDVSEAVIATDAGREGELVARWILEYVRFNKPVKRLWISSQTDKAIKDGFKKIRPAKDYDNLYYSALARAKADWLVGLNVTRALTVKYQDNLSAGRVQTPTLAMVRQQEKTIEQFKPQTYFTISLSVESEKAKMTQKNPYALKERQEAEQLVKEKNIQVMEDAGRGYRQVVASPKPKNIVELLTIQTLVDAGQTVIAGGGGGIPVIQEGNRLKGVNAVIEKDFCSERLAEQVDADLLVILTAVEKVCINFGKENQEALGNVSTEKMKQYAQEGQFAPGSMLPKVEAAIKFAESKPGRKTLITLLEKAKEGLSGKTGTLIENKES